MNKVIEIIKSRRSIRKYSEEQIKDEELNTIIEAATFAPSGHNDQPWHFTVLQNKELMDYTSEKTKKLMTQSDEEWIVKMGINEKFHLFYNAPTVIIISGRKDAHSSLIDCSAATQNMLLAAESLNIGSCWIGLIEFFFNDKEEVKKLNIPEGHTPYYAVTLGYKMTSTNMRALERKKGLVNYIK